MLRSSTLLTIGLLVLGLSRAVVTTAEPSAVASELLDTVQTVRGIGASSIKDGGGNSGGGDVVEPPNDPEAAVRQVYEDDVNALIVSAAGGCTSSGCHGRAGAPGGLRLYSSAEVDSVDENYQSFLRYIGSESADRLLGKISGNSHGGGTRYDSDSAEYAVIEAWAFSVEALP